MNAKTLPLHRRLAVQTGFLVVAVSAVTLICTGWLLAGQIRDTLARQVILRVMESTNAFSAAAGASLLSEDPEYTLHPMVQKVMDATPDLDDLVVLDAGFLIQGHADLQRVGEKLDLVETGAPLIEMGATRAWLTEKQIVIRRPIAHAGEQVGFLVSRVNRTGIDEGVQSVVIRASAILAAGMVLLTLLIQFLVSAKLRPLAPLRNAVSRIGNGDLTTRLTVKSRNELGLLADLINEMAGGLEAAHEQQLRQVRLDQELEIAANLQAMLIPERLPEVRGFELAAHYSAALEVSGDYYDVIGRRDGSCWIVVADVSGKGVPAMVIMAMTRSAIRSLVFESDSPREILVAADRILSPSIPRAMFVTCLLAKVEADSDRITYANAGHCPPVIAHGDRAQPLPPGGNAVGMLPSPVFESNLNDVTVELPAGARMLLYTDGLTEAMNQQGEQLGLPAVLEEFARTQTASHGLEELLNLVAMHRQEALPSDDLTMVDLVREPAKVVVS